jgi:hypothetical protein
LELAEFKADVHRITQERLQNLETPLPNVNSYEFNQKQKENFNIIPQDKSDSEITNI